MRSMIRGVVVALSCLAPCLPASAAPPSARDDAQVRLDRIAPVLDTLRRLRRAAIPADFAGWAVGPPDPADLPPALLATSAGAGWSREAVAALLRAQGLAGPAPDRVGLLEKAASLGDMGAAAALAEHWFEAGDLRRAAAWAGLAGSRGATEADIVAVVLPSGAVPAEVRRSALARLFLAAERPPGLAGDLHAGRPDALARARDGFGFDARGAGPATFVLCAPAKRGEPLGEAQETMLRERALSLPDPDAASCLVQSTLAAIVRSLPAGEASDPPAWVADLVGPLARDALIETSLRTTRLGRPGLGDLALTPRFPAVSARRPEAPAWILAEAARGEADRRRTEDFATSTLTSDAQERYAAAVALMPAEVGEAAYAALEPARRAVWPDRPLPPGVPGGDRRSGYAGLLVSDLGGSWAATPDSGTAGALVVGFAEGTPASRMLRVGDIVVAFAGHPIGTAEDLVSAVGRAEPGDHAASILRGGRRMGVMLPAVAWPKAAAQSNLAGLGSNRLAS